MDQICAQCQQTDAVAVNNFKKKIIKDYVHIVKRMNKGYKDDFSYILNEINFLGVWSNVDKPEIIYEYFINYGM